MATRVRVELRAVIRFFSRHRAWCIRSSLAATLVAALLSVVLFLGLFGWLVHKPLTRGVMLELFDLKLDYAHQSDAPRLLLLAGSNARYSHSCAVLEKMLGRRCINGGVAAGLSFDYLSAVYKPILRAGDWVYLPLEYGYYQADEQALKGAVDNQLSFSYNKLDLASRGWSRFVYGAFSFDLSFLLQGLLEMVLQASGYQRASGLASMNAQGDQIGHDQLKALAYRQRLRGVGADSPFQGQHISAQSQQMIGEFIRWARANNICVVGGLPTILAQQLPSEQLQHNIAAFYASRGAGFVALDNRSGYAPAFFYDTAWHLHQQAQAEHSRRLVEPLRQAFTACSSVS